MNLMLSVCPLSNIRCMLTKFNTMLNFLIEEIVRLEFLGRNKKSVGSVIQKDTYSSTAR